MLQEFEGGEEKTLLTRESPCEEMFLKKDPWIQHHLWYPAAAQIAGLRARSISSSDRPFVSTTLPAMYKTARRQTEANPRYTVLIPYLFTKLKKYSPMTKLDICSSKEKADVSNLLKRKYIALAAWLAKIANASWLWLNHRCIYHKEKKRKS